MKFELTKYNVEKAKMVLKDLKGKSVMVNEISLYGVINIDITESVMFDGDPDPEQGYDGGKTDYVNLTFNFDNGAAVYSYCPDTHICHFWEETPDLICFQIEDIKEYVARKKFDLDFRLKQYEEFMSK